MIPKKRKGRPLLIAAAGVAFVSFAQCEHQPVGNLRPAPEIDAGPIAPVGNLRPVDIDTGAPTPSDAGAPTPTDSGALPAKDAGPMPKIGPVGNLRPPPPPPSSTKK